MFFTKNSNWLYSGFQINEELSHDEPDGQSELIKYDLIAGSLQPSTSPRIMLADTGPPWGQIFPTQQNDEVPAGDNVSVYHSNQLHSLINEANIQPSLELSDLINDSYLPAEVSEESLVNVRAKTIVSKLTNIYTESPAPSATIR
jgi:hypothetical protein